MNVTYAIVGVLGLSIIMNLFFILVIMYDDNTIKELRALKKENKAVIRSLKEELNHIKENPYVIERDSNRRLTKQREIIDLKCKVMMMNQFEGNLDVVTIVKEKFRHDFSDMILPYITITKDSETDQQTIYGALLQVVKRNEQMD